MRKSELRRMVSEQQELIEAYRKLDDRWAYQWQCLRHYAHNNGDLALREVLDKLERAGRAP